MADKITFFWGHIHPERTDVQLSLPELSFGPGPSELTTVQICVAKSQISLRVDGEPPFDLDTLRNVLTSIVTAGVDSLGFANGCGYTVEIVGCHGYLGQRIFGVGIPLLQKLTPNVEDEVARILPLVINDPEGKQRPLRRALTEFRHAILEPDDTPFHCFRAVEALMYYFDRNPRRGREPLCKALQIDNDWLTKTLEVPAGEIRHGKVVPVSESDRARSFRAAKEIISRFITLAESKVNQLSVDRFPVLR